MYGVCNLSIKKYSFSVLARSVCLHFATSSRVDENYSGQAVAVTNITTSSRQNLNHFFQKIEISS